jgi:hypothetical protein
MTKRSDTIAGQVDKFRQASQSIDPPAHIQLREGDRPFWDSVVRAREASTWSQNDLELAANLARCKADIERLCKEIGDEGDVVESARGTQIVNPKHTLLETLSRRAVALTRLLHIHPEATVTAKDRAKSATAHREAQHTIASMDDDLIAKPAQH